MKYLQDLEVEVIYNILQASQKERAAGKGGAAAQRDTIDYKLLRKDLRPFVPRIPVGIVRRAVYHQNQQETMINVHTLQYQIQQQQSDVKRLIQDQQSDMVMKLLELKRESMELAAGQQPNRGQAGKHGNQGGASVGFSREMEEKMQELRSDLHSQMGDLKTQVHQMQAQNTVILDHLVRFHVSCPHSNVLHFTGETAKAHAAATPAAAARDACATNPASKRHDGGDTDGTRSPNYAHSDGVDATISTIPGHGVNSSTICIPTTGCTIQEP